MARLMHDLSPSAHVDVTEGIGKQLAPDLDLMSEALPFFLRLQASGALA